MNWVQSTPNSLIWTAAQLAYPLRIDGDITITDEEQAYLLELQEQAVQYAENMMSSSLLTRTITATFNDIGSGSAYNPYVGELPFLPRGPIQSVTSVTDASGTLTDYSLKGWGNSTLLVLPSGYRSPLTVEYEAGYGDDPSDVPADIRGAIRSHVFALYKFRGAVQDRTITVVPESMTAMYRLHARNSCVF